MFNRSFSTSMRKLDRIGIVVLRSTTLCVAVSSFTRSWRLTVISIAAPCAAGFSTSASMIDIDSPSFCACGKKPESKTFHAGHTLQHQAVSWKWLSFLLLDCIHLRAHPGVENRGGSLDSSVHSPWIASLRIRLWRVGGELLALSSIAAQCGGQGGKGWEIKRKDSSTRSSGRKSGNTSETTMGQGVDRHAGFSNPSCAILYIWKSCLGRDQRYAGFPRLPQARSKGLCKAYGLCEKRVHDRVGQGLRDAKSFTGTGRSQLV